MTERTLSTTPRLSSAIVLAAATALLLSSCASSEEAATSDAMAGVSGPVGSSADAGEPVSGGTLSFGSLALPATLDPARTMATGSTGGTEMAAIYDVLVRFDGQGGEFEPQLAEDLTASEDGKTWTLTLRDGVTFSNGESLDAEAVRWSIDRYVANRGPDSQLWKNAVSSISAPDDSTVIFELSSPWATFPNMLAMGPGMIVAAQSDQAENFTPIGAGPFVLESNKPNEQIQLERREGYWGGDAKLDGVRFLPSAGGQQQLDMFNTGQLEMFFTVEAGIVADVVGAGNPGYLNVMNAGNDVLINNAEGRPGSDLRVRQALIKAVDPVAFDERTQDGIGRPSVALFSEASRWNTGAPASKYDPEGARSLLEEAKADGYDGKITFTTRQAPEAQARALAIQAMLNAVGFDAEVEFLNSTSDIIRVINVEKNYDLGQSALSIRDSAPFLKLYSVFHSGSTGNASGYSNPEMDELLGTLQKAGTQEEIQSAIDDIESLATETVPTLPLAAQDNLVVWQPEVQGASHSFADIMLLDEVWLS
ncbi:ABC transporter substrate-binding protein [Rhodococcus sp. H29-C3]|uniref:ABC transporter substrate-binding protein n=1 Tax=Rhodococcus sp. H29-C3 TaxID=3046307 RepID=UPI0024BA89CE|nr:ABC transporter substrate-binding protein [Rhodococcus sp. H29-C3]MDJ0362585.1 ABC transporter substrate-binding protein [Rhodococcus sp. H29-C3]